MPALLVHAGEFGGQVAGLLAARTFTGSVCLRAPGDDAELPPDGDHDLVVAAMWREMPSLARRLDAYAFLTGKPWLPVVLEFPVIRVGPLVVPGASACYECYVARRDHRDPAAEISRGLRDAQEDETLGATGFFPHYALLARGMVDTLLAPAAECGWEAAAGRVMTLTLPELTAECTTLAGLDHCPVCSSRFAARRAVLDWRLQRLAQRVAGVTEGQV